MRAVALETIWMSGERRIKIDLAGGQQRLGLLVVNAVRGHVGHLIVAVTVAVRVEVAPVVRTERRLC